VLVYAIRHVSVMQMVIN